METTNFSRKLDTTGRLIIPSKLRTELGLMAGLEYEFYTHDFEGKTYLCIQCGNAKETELQRALKILEQNGFIVSTENK